MSPGLSAPSGPLKFHEDLPGGGLEGLNDTRALVGHGFDHGFVPKAEKALNLGHGCCRGHIPFVQLKHVGNGTDIEPVFLEVGGQVGDGFDIGFHPGPLAIGHEDDAIATPEDELAAGIVKTWPGTV